MPKRIIPAVSKFARQQSPFRSPPWRPFHTVAFAAFCLFVLATFLATGLVADVGAMVLGGEDWLVRLRLAVVGLMAYHVFAVRAVPWWRALAYSIIGTGTLMNVARGEWDTFSPLTMSFGLVLIGIMIEASGVTFRPTMSERVQEAEAELADCRRAMETEVNLRDDRIHLLRVKLAEHGIHDPTEPLARPSEEVRS